MAFFLPKHSSAAKSRLTEDNPLSKPPHSPGRHRRLESEVNWIDQLHIDTADCHLENTNDNDDDEPAATKSTSFSSSTDDDDDSDDDSDDSDDDEVSLNGSLDEHSVTSATTTSSTSLSEMIGGDYANYEEGDLQRLNSLVHKLHAAELKRESKSRPPLPPTVDDVPSVLPHDYTANTPHFSPLQSTHHRLSISAVDSWRGSSFEIVPTESVEGILPKWKSEWTRDRLEWEDEQKRRRRSAVEFKRSRTVNDGVPASTHGDELDAIGLQRRNNSLPNALFNPTTHTGAHSKIGLRNRSASTSLSSSHNHRHYKYGKPPTLPNAKNPNPMVSKSSKKINRKHARYVLTAGMMLGIRESVGGALGVEAELEISNWVEGESRWRENEEDGDEEEGDERKKKEGLGGQEVQLDESKLQGQTNANNTPQDSSQQPQATDNSQTPSPTRKSTSSSQSLPTRQSQAYTTLTRECERVTKYKFPPHQFYLGSNTSKPLPHKYKFKVYAPLVFARIRSLFGVEKQTFLHSICGKFNFYEFASNARSGQFFFYSHDGRYMIKTLTQTESKFLREILPHYYQHLSQNPSTFLTHFYGMYRVAMPNANNQRLHFIIMRSVFFTEKKIDRVWDLKGSTAGRRADGGDTVHKDLDILEEGRKLRFREPEARGRFLGQLARDATFLARLGIMDYSLLLGCHDGDSEDGEGAGENSAVGNSGNAVENAATGAVSATSGEAASPPGDANSNDNPSTPRNSQKTLAGREEPLSRSNTPFRRGIIQRASSAGDTKVGNDGFKALEVDSSSSSETKEATSDSDAGRTTSASSALGAIPESPGNNSTSGQPLSMSSCVPKNAITSRSDSGIEGYGLKLEDGRLAKREIYFCGIIDILQYYNARKMGETVIRKAAGNSGQDISCVDPETYGKRFVKFISNLVEE
eukprot:CAMPEP_0172308002 /NCGR_PEP_ID=MMETSP1058-20130122/8732_1 /TAXON_ID=83371 /ORGANISM="Detonula confervacea, Strain CCMP 353" /LENGTH=921 /DNA_ID=CAMNT_0013020331 /DNA_START=165 /DNA_END=2930 /DNA_ORIENTATION=-